MQVGAFRYSFTNNGNGTVTYRIENDLTVNSFFFHIPEKLPAWQKSAEKLRTDVNVDPQYLMGKMTQVFEWTEPNPTRRPAA